MTRLIPGKTNVQIELFRGITLGDVLIASIAAVMLIFVLISSLPHKFGICIGIGVFAGLLLIRLDEQPNYLYILHILSHFGYDRQFSRIYTDKMLAERGKESSEGTAPNEPLRQPPEQRETKAQRKKREKAERDAEKAHEKALKQERKREDKILKSKKHTEEEKEQIRLKRAEEEAQRLAEKEKQAQELAEKKDKERAEAREKRLTKKKRKEEKKEEKAQEKARVNARKEEDRRLKSPDVPEEEKEQIRERRAAENATTMRRMAEVNKPC